MSFLSPATIALAAGLTVPPLIALYFLKLKRSVRMVPSTLLWKKSVEDLHVNSPFQRLRSSVLLLLQLLILLLAALALGKPMLEMALAHESTIIILVDQSASMAVMEADGRTRLDMAKHQAKRVIDGMDEDSRAMVIAFCDRATVVSSFDTDRQALKRKIESIEQTQSASSLGEAMSLAEAYTQNIIIGSDEAGADRAPDSVAPPATVFIFTDGRVEDADKVTLQKFDVDNIHVTSVGKRADNVGIIAMNARRNYETPEILEVSTTIENFGPDPVALDAVLYIDGENVDVQSIELGPLPDAPGLGEEDHDSPVPTKRTEAADSVGVIAFDEIEFGGGGTVEVVLRIDDALSADNRAWSIIDEPRHVQVLLVSGGNWFLDSVLQTLPLTVEKMTPAQYEQADERDIQDGDRSRFDVVIFDDHSTARLPQGNYFFWGGIPTLDGLSRKDIIANEVIFNWDETHPVLRYVGVEALYVYEWHRLVLPPEAVSIIDGQSSPVLAYLSRDASQYLISAFSLIAYDEKGRPLMNTKWVTTADFVVFMQNTIQFLSGTTSIGARKSVRPGSPITLPIPGHSDEIKVHRPDGVVDRVPAVGFDNIHYARTRQVGVYRLDPGLSGNDVFAVNLFNEVESHVRPAEALALGAVTLTTKAASIQVNRPAWSYFLFGLLVLLLLEWVIYNQRIFV
ncbi:MAG: VWA domain-containing protein [Planctomycetes bacterium]|nr:VWA domain-containing protein [Planctomycetota bacterium]